MNRAIIILSCLVVPAFAACGEAADWPRFLGPD
jgi:hypothetical protein